MVTWRDTIWPGERLGSPSPVGESWIDRGEAPFARRTAVGAVSIGLQCQATWRAPIVPRGHRRAIGRTAEICTEIEAVFSMVGVGNRRSLQDAAALAIAVTFAP